MSTPNPGAEVPSFLAWPFPHRPHPGDPIDMEFILDKLAPDTRNQLIAVRLEAVAAVHQAVAEGARKAASLIAGANG
ncbi:hypothetical protein ABZW30_34215 [Kitasatospora sp. NPDC004669]|uniref:hypothetical protein n=1 Tax=Kitasatospora sp. NPDC004669 TaxID=3154555 RepID=UPI00339ECEAD